MRVKPGTIVLLQATLTGMGHTAECEVLVRKITTISSGAVPQFGSTYTDCSILGAPDDLPDGDYTIRFDGFNLSATCHGGHWLPNGQAQQDTDARQGYFPIAG